MQIRKNILIFSNNSNNLQLLLEALSDLEYKLDMQIDIIIKENYTELERKKLINCIIYLLQINYSQHNFRIFISDKNLLKEFKLNKEIANTKRNINIYSLLGLINEDIINDEGNLINNNRYKEIKNIKVDRIEVFYTAQNLKVDIHGNDTI